MLQILILFLKLRLMQILDCFPSTIIQTLIWFSLSWPFSVSSGVPFSWICSCNVPVLLNCANSIEGIAGFLSLTDESDYSYIFPGFSCWICICIPLYVADMWRDHAEPLAPDFRHVGCPDPHLRLPWEGLYTALLDAFRLPDKETRSN